MPLGFMIRLSNMKSHYYNHDIFVTEYYHML